MEPKLAILPRVSSIPYWNCAASDNQPNDSPPPQSRSRKASRKKGGVRGGAVGAGPGGKYRWVDLHGLTVDQAVELLDRLLVSLRSKGEREELGEEELGEEEKSLVGHEVRRAWISRPMTVW